MAKHLRPTPKETAPRNPDIFWHETLVNRAMREDRYGHHSTIVWFTGLSGSGKSTIANMVGAALHTEGLATYILDGDNIRHGLCRDLGFSDSDREENIRRIGEVAKLFVDAGVIVLTAFVSPFRSDRERVRMLVDDGDFLEVHCAADLNICEQRDPKGLYAKARAGLIEDFTGISSPYEIPEAPELSLDTGSRGLSDCVDDVLSMLRGRLLIPARALQVSKTQIVD
ncbi:adenylyl-sulfate kinase [cyanobiont of Ornithocercus magnificus]|nr:adenylyl-sulfate kinase [cyanobiont of Ornithocercus magnificus]